MNSFKYFLLQFWYGIRARFMIRKKWKKELLFIVNSNRGVTIHGEQCCDLPCFQEMRRLVQVSNPIELEQGRIWGGEEFLKKEGNKSLISKGIQWREKQRRLHGGQFTCCSTCEWTTSLGATNEANYRHKLTAAAKTTLYGCRTLCWRLSMIELFVDLTAKIISMSRVCYILYKRL